MKAKIGATSIGVDFQVCAWHCVRAPANKSVVGGRMRGSTVMQRSQQTVLLMLYPHLFRVAFGWAVHGFHCTVQRAQAPAAAMEALPCRLDRTFWRICHFQNN